MHIYDNAFLAWSTQNRIEVLLRDTIFQIANRSNFEEINSDGSSSCVDPGMCEALTHSIVQNILCSLKKFIGDKLGAGSDSPELEGGVEPWTRCRRFNAHICADGQSRFARHGSFSIMDPASTLTS